MDGVDLNIADTEQQTDGSSASTQPVASGSAEDTTQRVLRSHTQPTDGTITKVSKAKTPRVYSCDVCHSKHLPPTGAKCLFGPPSTEEGHPVQAGGGEVSMNLETLNKIAHALHTVTARLDSIEHRLDNGGGSATVMLPPVMPPLRGTVTLTPTLADLKADRVIVLQAEQLVEDVNFSTAGNDVIKGYKRGLFRSGGDNQTLAQGPMAPGLRSWGGGCPIS
jgi:hypothetical protein